MAVQMNMGFGKPMLASTVLFLVSLLEPPDYLLKGLIPPGDVAGGQCGGGRSNDQARLRVARKQMVGDEKLPIAYLGNVPNLSDQKEIKTLIPRFQALLIPSR